MPQFIRAFKKTDKNGVPYIVYIEANGNKYFRKGGSFAWRNTNPGNITSAGGFARRHGAIGSDGRFAIFPDFPTGRDALRALITGPTYRVLTIYNAVARYAPDTENDTPRYRRQVADFTGLDINRRISTLSFNEVGNLLDAIQRIEGWIVGTDNYIKKVIRTKVDRRGRLVEFLIEGENEYIDKNEAIRRAEEMEIDAVVVAGSGGTYIRAFGDATSQNNFDELREV